MMHLLYDFAHRAVEIWNRALAIWHWVVDDPVRKLIGIFLVLVYLILEAWGRYGRRGEFKSFALNWIVFPTIAVTLLVIVQSIAPHVLPALLRVVIVCAFIVICGIVLIMFLKQKRR